MHLADLFLVCFLQTIRNCDCAEGQCYAKDMYIDQLKDLLRHETPKKIAGMFAESIQVITSVQRISQMPHKV